VSRGRLTRREALVAGAAVALFPETSVAARARRNPIARGGTFSSGVAAGAPTTGGALLWTRCDGIGKARIGVEVASDPDFRTLVHRGVAQVTPVRDATARVVVRGLKPGENYWYRFGTRTVGSPIGRFRTLRPPDSREPLRIGWFSCQRYEHGYFTPQAALAAEDLDLVVSLGDYIYEEDSTPKLPERKDPSGAPNGHTETLAQFRNRYRTYRTDPNLLEMHAAHAVVPIWDDCEVEGNWAGERESSGGSPSGARRVPFSEKRRAGFLAYFENMPVLRPRHGDRFKVYRSLDVGGVAELLLLDTRQYRAPQPCGDADFTSPDAALCRDDGGRRLGDAQKAWLKERLAGSRATWKILANAQMMMALDILPGQRLENDSWAGYEAERREVLEFAHGRGVRNLVSIVGDVHVFFAGDLTTTGRVGGRPIGTEFVGASVSHDGFSLGLQQDVSDTVAEQLPLTNPHLRYAEFSHRGYAVLEATPAELTVSFKAVRSVLTPRSESFLLRRFKVRDGDPRVRAA